MQASVHRDVVGAGWGVQLSGKVQNMHMKKKGTRKGGKGDVDIA